MKEPLYITRHLAERKHPRRREEWLKRIRAARKRRARREKAKAA